MKVTLTIKQLKRLVKESYRTTYFVMKKDAENALADYYTDKLNHNDIYHTYIGETYSDLNKDIENDGFVAVAGSMFDIEIFANGFKNDSTVCITKVERDDKCGWVADFVELDDEMKDKCLRIVSN